MIIHLKSSLLGPRPALALLALAAACSGDPTEAAAIHGTTAADSGGDADAVGTRGSDDDTRASDDGTVASDDGTVTSDAGTVTSDADSSVSDEATATDTADATTPTVSSTTPVDEATLVPLDASLRATFSEAMNADTLTATTFVVTVGEPAVAIEGSVIYADSTAFFSPAAQLASDSTFTATITTGAESANGVALAANHEWSFTTGEATAAAIPVNLGGAGEFAMLAKTGITCVPSCDITGDIGVSPIDSTSITGFTLIPDDSNTYSTSAQVNGRVFAADHAPPTPALLTTAVGDMEIAFTDAAGRASDIVGLGAGDISGMSLAPGVYRWDGGLLISTDVTLEGNASDVWIFQIAQSLTMSSGASVLLAGGAVPERVFWQVSGLVNLATTAHCEGVVLTMTSVDLSTGASINGRLLAQTAITLGADTVVEAGR